MAMETVAMANTNAALAGRVAEAGSREAPPLPPGLLTADLSEVGGRPTKLFIGGISRHTTTKQLRDHFSQFGRVMDCVAMRQPDGRPRGFGYVTLDSMSAAERCLAEPQNIDNRIVDMKLAVPEGSSGQTSPCGQAGFGMNMFGSQADFNMGMYAGQGYNGWPEASGNFGNTWWPSAKSSPMSNQGLDCVDLLSAARELAVNQGGSPHGLPGFGFQDCGDREGYLMDEPAKTLLPEAYQQAAGAALKMRANAAEFVPMGAQAPKQPAVEAAEAPGKKAVRTRPVLGELTNIVEVEDLLKPFKSPSAKLAPVGHGTLVSPEGDAVFCDPVPSTGLLLDDESSSPSSSGLQAESPATSSEEQDTPLAKVQTTPNTEDTEDTKIDQLEDNKGPVSPVSSNDNDSESGSDTDSIDKEQKEAMMANPDLLPSMGSLQHFAGECKRCNFYPKGRCQNGKDCTFCHFPHDKRKPSRQEKRERRAAWLEQQGEVPPMEQQEQSVQPQTGPLFSTHTLQQVCFPSYPDEDIYSDETLSYMPWAAAKLPAPLPLPALDMTNQMGPALPPGLAPPALAAAQWQPEAEATAAAPCLLSTGATMQSMFGGPQVVSSALSSTFLSSTAFSTVPTPASTANSTPLPTPCATPTAAMAAAQAEARPIMVTMELGTQTGDYKCRKCEVVPKTEALSEDAEQQGQQFPRNELLQLRDGLLKMWEASGSNLRELPIRTVAAASI